MLLHNKYNSNYYIRALIYVSVFIVLSVRVSAQALVIDSSGAKLRAFYQHMDVTHLWLKGHNIDWETGRTVSDGISNNNTYCTRFVAATCKRLNICTLRPTDYETHFSANAMFDWMQTSEAKKKGWVPIIADDPFDVFSTAQKYANKGTVVVVVYKDNSGGTPGHSALVMPAVITYDEVKKSGPVLIQAGNFNSDSTRFMRTFRKRIQRWPDDAISFYYNKNKVF
jgi:hypothetical protein